MVPSKEALRLLRTLWLVPLMAGGCAEGTDEPIAKSDDDGGSEVGGKGGSGEGGSGKGGADGGSAFGLQQRPKNTTCKPFAAVDEAPSRLSVTGCVEGGNPKEPASGLIPFDVNAPLWSDGADKQRFFALPEGEKITIEDDGDWTFPVGAVLMKTFAFGDRMIETRLLVHFDESTWVGYSYEWREDQSDADLLPDNIGGYRRMVENGRGDKQSWHFPSRSECLQCHTQAARVALGPESAQLQRSFAYGAGKPSPQIETLQHIDVVEGHAAVAALPRPGGEAGADGARDRTAEARAYLHSNCAGCHRPGGNFEAMDLRFDTPLARMGICNVAPEKGDLGVQGARLLVPGDASRSLLSLRMHKTDQSRMPQIGTSVVDPTGTELVKEWIGSLKSCE